MGAVASYQRTPVSPGHLCRSRPRTRLLLPREQEPAEGTRHLSAGCNDVALVMQQHLQPISRGKNCACTSQVSAPMSP